MEDAYKKAQEEKTRKALNILKANPESWSDEERKTYYDKTLINLLPMNRMVLIKELDYKAESKGGIMLVKTADTKPLIIGMVAAVAPDCRFLTGEDGKSMPGISIKAGDVVSYAVYNGDQIEIFGERFFRVRDMDIHFKIPEAQLAEMVIDRSDLMWTIRKEMTYNAENPNQTGPESSYHVDHASQRTSKKQLKIEGNKK